MSIRIVFEDRKSTRLNSSHSQISYAVFCLKKKHHLICKLINCQRLRTRSPAFVSTPPLISVRLKCTASTPSTPFSSPYSETHTHSSYPAGEGRDMEMKTSIGCMTRRS